MMLPDQVPPVRDARWRRLGLAMACIIPLLFVLFWVVFRQLSGNVSYAVWAAGILVFAISASVALAARATWAPRLTGRRQLNVVLVGWAMLLALAAALLAAAAGAPAGWAVVLGAVAGVVGGGFYARLRAKVTASQTVFPLTVETLDEAELLRVATEHPNHDPKAPPDHRAMQRLNHARALTTLAMRDDDSYRLMEALPLLRAAVQDPALDPSVALLAGDDLITAESILAERGRDGSRYAQAIELYTQLVRESPGIPAGQVKLHTARAEYQQYQMRAASEDFASAASAGDQAGSDRALERARAAYRAVERELRAALELTDRSTGIGVQCLTMLGSHLCLSFEVRGEDRSGEGVDLCRRALSERAGRTRDQRPLTELALATCLVTRSDQHGDGRDLDEAERILRRLVRHGNPVEARARMLLLEIASRRPELPG